MTPSLGPWLPPLYLLSLWGHPLQVSQVSETRQHLSFYALLQNLSLTFSRLIHVVAYVRMSLVFRAEYYYMVCIDPILLIHSPADGHLGGFHVLALVNNTAMNTSPHISRQGPGSFFVPIISASLIIFQIFSIIPFKYRKTIVFFFFFFGKPLVI